MDPPPETRPAKLASTLVLVRDGAEGVEVLMVKRSERSSFMGGVYVFPGGGVDEQDAAALLHERMTGLTDERATVELGLGEGGLDLWASAVRELFEESGIMLAHDPQGIPVVLTGEVADRFVAHRAALNAGQRGFADVIVEEDLTIDAGVIHHHAHWITPTTAAKRFDTYFFVAAAPPHQMPAHDEAETVAVEWITPAEALRRHREGLIEMVLPTIRSLQLVQEHDTVADLLATAASLSDIPSILPKMVDTPEGPILLVPGDEGYDEIPAAPDDPSLFPEAARRRAARENPPVG